jgi:hypothetical protein
VEEKIIKVVKVEHEEPLEDLNEPVVGRRYLYSRDTPKSRLKEGRVLEVSKSGYWIKMFDGKTAEWIHFGGFGVFEKLAAFETIFRSIGWDVEQDEHI